MKKFYENPATALFVILILAATVSLTGLSTGLPSRERLNLVFANDKQIGDNIPAMISARKEHYDKVERIRQSGLMYVGQNLSAKGGRPLAIEEYPAQEVIGSLRSFFLGSAIGDETWVFSIISRMNPRKLDFNPKTIMYGGTYIYSLCLILGTACLLGITTISSDISYFFTHPEAVAGLFVIFRILSVLSLVAASALLFRITKKLYGTRTGLLASTLLILAPTIVYNSHIAKPHIYAMFWSLLSFYYAAKILKSNERKHYVLGGISCGLALGTLLPNGLIFLSLLFAEYLKERKILKIFNKNIFTSVLCMTAAFVITNPYAVFSNILFATSVSSSQVWNYGKFNLAAISDTIDMLFLGAVNWTYLPLLLLGIAAVLRSASKFGYLLLFTAAAFIVTNVLFMRHAGLFCTAVPFIAMLCALAVRWLYTSGKTARMAGALYLAAALFISGWNAFMVVEAFHKEQNLMAAGEWINVNTPKGSAIGLPKNEYLRPATGPYMRFLDHKIFMARYDLFPAGGDYLPEYVVAFDIGKKYELEFKERMLGFYDLEKEFLNQRGLMAEIANDHAYPYHQPDVYIYRRK